MSAAAADQFRTELTQITDEYEDAILEVGKIRARRIALWAEAAGTLTQDEMALLSHVATITVRKALHERERDVGVRAGRHGRARGARVRAGAD